MDVSRRRAYAQAGDCRGGNRDALPIATFVNLGWLTPEANQRYREMMIPREYRTQNDPLPRGFNELTWTWMRARLRESRALGLRQETRAFEMSFHRRLAIVAAAPPMVGMMLGLAFRRQWGRAPLSAAAIVICAADLVVGGAGGAVGARLGLPTIVIGWCATALCAAAALLITWLPSRARA